MSLPSEFPLPAEDRAGLYIAPEVVAEPGSSEDLRSLQPPLTVRELAAVLLLVALCDATIYRGTGFAGLAVLFLISPVLLLAASPRPRLGTGFWIVGGMLLLEQLSARRADWEPYLDEAKRRRALDRFDAYVYQWY